MENVMSNSLKNMWVIRNDKDGFCGQVIKCIGSHTVLLEYARSETAEGPPYRELATVAQLVEEHANFFHSQCEMEAFFQALDDWIEEGAAAKAKATKRKHAKPKLVTSNPTVN
jgi:hypothetical protein